MWWCRKTGKTHVPLPLAFLLIALVLPACGFQVRGASQLPPEMKSVYIDAENHHSPFYRELTTKIRNTDIQMTGDAASADSVIRVLSDETGRRTLSVSARNVPREYEVYYIVNYAVSFNGKEVLEPQRLLMTRFYTYDETEVLGKANEEEALRESMAADLVGMLVRQVDSIN